MRTDGLWLLVLGSQASSIDAVEEHIYRCAETGRTDAQAEETLRQMRAAHRDSLSRAPVQVLEQFSATYGDTRHV